MSSTRSPHPELVAAYARLEPALDDLAAAYRAAVRVAARQRRRAAVPEGPVPPSRLLATIAWRAAYDALRAKGAHPRTPDGRVCEIRLAGGVVRVERRAGTNAFRVVRHGPETPGAGPLAARFPWLRVV